MSDSTDIIDAIHIARLLFGLLVLLLFFLGFISALKNTIFPNIKDYPEINIQNIQTPSNDKNMVNYCFIQDDKSKKMIGLFVDDKLYINNKIFTLSIFGRVNSSIIEIWKGKRVDSRYKEVYDEIQVRYAISNFFDKDGIKAVQTKLYYAKNNQIGNKYSNEILIKCY